MQCFAALVPPSAAADGRQWRRDIATISFEMVRRSVYSAAQMKVSHKMMLEAKGKGGGGGGEVGEDEV